MQKKPEIIVFAGPSRFVSDISNKFSEIETKLDEADLQAKADQTRYTHDEVFSSIREQLRNR